MNRTDEFIGLYNQLDEHLAQLVGEDTRTPFYSLLEKAAKRSLIRKREEARLKTYGSLRNIIVHDADYPERVLAEPTEETLEHFRRVVQHLMDPPTLNDFTAQVRTFSKGDALFAALAYMREEDFSQVVVREEGELSLLTTEGIAKWLEQQVQEDDLSVADAELRDALAFEVPGSFQIMSRRETLGRAQEAFTRAIEQGQPRLYAVIITENGKPHETPLGVVSAWDVIEDD